MYVLMIYQTALLTDCLHNYTFSHHDVCIDMLSASSYQSMPYYRLHRYRGTENYVCVCLIRVLLSLNDLLQTAQA